MIQKLINPNSIAVVGASVHPEKIGHQIVKNLMDSGFGGKIFPVNPKNEPILGLDTYRSISEISEPIDLAVLAIPAQAVFSVIEECADKKISAVIIISAGFGEVGEEGEKLQDEIVKICRKHDISLLGPNCLGVINTKCNLNASFAASMPKAGNIAFISQSGAIISSIIDWSKSSPIGFSTIFSLGNKALLSETDLLDFLYEDNSSDVILAYLESLSVNDELTDTLIKNAKKKPTIVLFGGKSELGAKAAKSHTGSLVSSYLAVETYLKQAGVILVDNMEELLLLGRIFSRYSKINGRQIAIITNAGGPAITASDALHAVDLKLAGLSEETRSNLKNRFRPESNINNPIDILGDASDIDYKNALEIVEKDPNVDAILVLLTPQTATKIDESAKAIAETKSDKPILSSFVGGAILATAREVLENFGKPSFSFPEEAVLALKYLASFSLDSQTLEAHVSKKSNFFESGKREEILEEYKLPIIKYYTVNTSSMLEGYAKKIGYPVVLKTADPTIHKTDAGKIALNINSLGALEAAFRQIGAPAVIGKMIKPEFEVLIGVKHDANIGNVIIFGTGGIYAEIYQDFSERITPLSLEMARSMILETKIGAILSGARNQKPYDLEELARILVATACLADDYSNIKEIDFNPIIINREGFFMPDLRIILDERMQ